MVLGGLLRLIDSSFLVYSEPLGDSSAPRATGFRLGVDSFIWIRSSITLVIEWKVGTLDDS